MNEEMVARSAAVQSGTGEDRSVVSVVTSFAVVLEMSDNYWALTFASEADCDTAMKCMLDAKGTVKRVRSNIMVIYP